MSSGIFPAMSSTVALGKHRLREPLILTFLMMESLMMSVVGGESAGYWVWAEDLSLSRACCMSDREVLPWLVQCSFCAEGSFCVFEVNWGTPRHDPAAVPGLAWCGWLRESDCYSGCWEGMSRRPTTAWGGKSGSKEQEWLANGRVGGGERWKFLHSPAAG